MTRSERFTGDVLHHDEVDALVGTDVVNRDDSGMVQGAGGLGLLDEPLPPKRIGHPVLRQDLDGDVAIELCVAGQVDNAHAAFAQLRLDPVAAQHPPNHRHRGV